MSEHRKDLVAALAQSLKAIDDDYREEMRELRALFHEAKAEAEKDEPDGVKLRALLADGNEMVKTFAGLDPVWQGVQRVAKLFGML
jgi:TATA-binding protein-associated factor Taf7